MTGKINIIILTYNCLNKIKQCLNSIYEHTKQDFNLFIIENNSQDGTREYIKKISEEKNNIYISLQKENLGIIKGRNAGFNLFKTINKNNEYIIFLDADQYVKKIWLDSYLKMTINYDVIGTEAWKMRDDFYPYKRITNKEENFSYVGGGGLMMKSAIFEELDLFDERYTPMYFEDPDFNFTAHQNGFKIGWNSEPVIIHDHKGPLLNKENKIHFMNSWKKFQEKWEGFKVPKFKIY